MTRTALLLLFLASPLWGAPPEVPTSPLKLKVGEDTEIVVKVADGKKGSYRAGFRSSDCLFFRGYSPDESTMTFLVRPKVPGFYVVPFWTVGEGASSVLEIDATGSGPLPPTPPEPPGPPTPPGPVDPPVTTKATAATYVYEKDAGGVPNAVMASLNKLNRGEYGPDKRSPRLVATAYEDDSPNGSGGVPKQYQAAVTAAREAGLPALVFQAGDKVLKVVKAPKTAAEVEAVP